MEASKLDEFIFAQDRVYDQVRSELSAGQKRTHWMWYIFPQIAGLGASAMARRYALTSLDEARAYLAHPVLSDRLHECTGLLLASPERNVTLILGSPDDMKFRSSMTLFAAAAPDDGLFRAALEKFFGGVPDAMTVELLERQKMPSALAKTSTDH